jgi:methylated-DNA-[protein]-cysteine S-methyltransferase
MQKNNFKLDVLAITSTIPKGQVKTYQQIATLAGKPRAYRTVGSILKQNYNPTIPCHRVIKADGTIGQYNRGSQNKLRLLKKEGVAIDKNGKIIHN